jgi:hypothetical protein
MGVARAPFKALSGLQRKAIKAGNQGTGKQPESSNQDQAVKLHSAITLRNFDFRRKPPCLIFQHYWNAIPYRESQPVRLADEFVIGFFVQ